MRYTNGAKIRAISVLTGVKVKEISRAAGYTEDVFSKIINGAIRTPPDFPNRLRGAFRKLEEKNRLNVNDCGKLIGDLGAFASELFS